MIHVSSISFSVLSYVTENEKKVNQCLFNCLPEELRGTKINILRTQSQFKDKLRIHSLVFKKKADLKKIVAFFSKSIDNKDHIIRYFTQILDIEERVLHLRFDKFKAFDGQIEVTFGSDVIKCEISYTTFEQSQNTFESVKELFESKGLL